MSPTSFEIFGITGADLPHPGIALASARAGGIGVLDLEFVTDPEQARTNFARLLRSAQGRIGLRITAGQASLARSLLISAGERSITVILTGASSEIGRIRNASGVHSHHFCCAEIRSASDLEQIQSHCDALVVRGHEAGGWVGEDSSFILLQKLSGQVHKPLYVQGGAAVRGAAACRLAGAAGLVLDDAMLLMAESPLSVTLQQELARLNGAECRLFGEFHGAPCRAYARPGAQVLTDAENDSRALEGGQSTPLEWAERMHGRIGWQSSDQQLLPIGQSIGLAATYRDQYGNVGKLIQAVKRQSLRQMDLAAQSRFIDEGGALADSHRTRFPIAQGPMTRVSDHAGFAGEVAKAGGLPFLARPASRKAVGRNTRQHR
ncbi:MAG: nitronate monooxygenase [Panacagrimonas sp.]